MPYIKKEDRKQYEQFLKEVEPIKTKGDLEYCIFKLMKIYMYDKDYRYSTLHDCVYAAQHCADEFRRRFLDKREDEALIENGDVDNNISGNNKKVHYHEYRAPNFRKDA